MFTHLHVHTEYSPLDGLSKIEDLMVRAKELGQSSIAITDHGSTSGLFEAFELGKIHNIKPILGCEFYVENKIDEKRHGHLILLAKDNNGLANLFKLQQLSYMENFYYKPRISMDMLKEYNNGLICTTACMANQIGQLIIADEPVMALKYFYDLKEIFKKDLYLEIQSSTIPKQIKINKKYEEWYKEGVCNVVITNDVHYTLKEDAIAHEVLLAIQQNKKMSDPKRWKFDVNDFWLKSEEEIISSLSYLDGDTVKFGIEATNHIAEQCNTSIESGHFLPSVTENEGEVLAAKTYAGYENKIFKRGEANNEYFKDMVNELKVIEKTGYSGYFLIVEEYANWARENGILVGDGRGSGTGSKVAYALGITEINPQKYDLLFERFLAVGREPDSVQSRVA